MCRKLIYLTFFVLVLGLVLTNAANAADPGLVGWWKLDGNATDSSGNGHDGVLFGNPEWVAGKIGGALKFDGVDDRVEVPGTSQADGFPAVRGEVTWAVWIKTSATPTGSLTFMCQGPTGGAHVSGNRSICVEPSGQLMLRANGVGALTSFSSTAAVNDGQWHHIAVTIAFETNGTNDTAKIYIDGDLSKGYTVETANINANAAAGNSFIVTLGYRANSFDGLIDDARVYNHALSEVEIRSAMTAKPWPYAFGPDPADGAVHVGTWVNLIWLPGELAVSHDVYLGDNFEDVNTGTGDTFRGNLTIASLPAGFPGYAYPGGLVPGTTYYWRIDEVNNADPNSPWKGDVWSFFVPPKKAYKPQPADDARFVPPVVTLTWIPGTGAILHTAYFGDKFDDVNNAAGGLPMVTTSYTPAGPLEQGKTYYWRVDEFDGAATHKGDIWSFETIPVVAIADPNLVVLWTLDEGMGTSAVDWSGHGHHGAIIGGAQWVDGYEGTALKFADNVYVESAYPGITGTAARTCCAWIKTSTANCTIMSWGQNVATQKWRVRLDATGGLRIENNGGNLYGVTNLADNLWHHVAVVFADDGSPDLADTLLYVDGRAEMTAAVTASAMATAAGPLRIGEDPWHNAPWLDVIDEARVYNKALTQEQIALIMRVDPLLAWAEKPVEDSTPDIEHVTPLSWTRGDKATQHGVYFGLDKAAVASADASDTTGIYRGRQSATSYTPAEGVGWGGGPYFWRVDENNNDGTITKGRIWSFTVADYLVVDDIESYNDLVETDPASNRIYTKWIDGFGTTTNGALVGNLDVPLTQHSNVHGGGQAMPLSYDNNLKFSEATLTLAAGKDWTRQGVRELSLWFRGVAANTAERMYVALNGTAVVYNDDTSLTQKTAWTQWTIPLQQFANLGVNLSNVTSITIGFGTRGNTATVGGTGQMYFDDIRLYRSKTTP